MREEGGSGMFRPVAPWDGAVVSMSVFGRTVTVPAGMSVAAALLHAGESWTRNAPVSGARRAPYCAMGACFECLVTIDGRPDLQACMITVREGMRVERPVHARR